MGSANAENDFTTSYGQIAIEQLKDGARSSSPLGECLLHKADNGSKLVRSRADHFAKPARTNASQGGKIVDVGGGASFLVDRLVSKGTWDITVLDISSTAMEYTNCRLGDAAAKVHYCRLQGREGERG